jgi:hypothetical protein
MKSCKDVEPGGKMEKSYHLDGTNRLLAELLR